MKFISLFLALFGFGADVVTVTSGTVGNAGNVAASLITYLSAQMLEVAELNTVLDQFGDKTPLPSNSSKTIRFVREEKLSVSASPTQLSEGIAPDAVGITLNQFEATVEQYGNVVRISDLAELTAKHPIVQRTIFVLGLQAAETYDQLIFNVLDAATNVYRPNSKAADTDLVGSDHVTYVDLIALMAILQDQGARPFDGGEYVFVTPPQVHAAMLKDPDFKASNQFAKPDRIWRGEVDVLGGFRVVRTNAPGFAATSQAGSGDADKVYSSFALGRFAYQITDLQNLQFYMVQPGGHTDPLQQSRKMGWKFAFKSLITNQNWIRRVRSAGLNSRTNP
jgi:N4-gp56 family major capsid protein